VIQDLAEAAVAQGTDVKVTGLFYNTPARLKFLKSINTEFDHITEMVVRMALVHPETHFRLIHNGREVLDFLPTREFKDRLSTLWGAPILEQLLELNAVTSPVLSMTGYFSPPTVNRSSRRHVYTFINKRWVSDPLLNGAIYAGYRPLLPSERFPMAVLYIEIDPEKVDVNVHPAKTEVRFMESRQVFEAVRQAVNNSIVSQDSQRNRSLFSVPSSKHATGRIMEWANKLSLARGLPAIIDDTALNFPAPVLLDPHKVLAAGEKKTLLGPLKVLAQLNDSYILCQIVGGLAILDQHAAHERIVYEKLKKSYQTGSMPKQALLLPELFELSPVDFNLLSKALNNLEKLGLEIEQFGGTSMVIRFLPAVLSASDVRNLVAEIVDALHDEPHIFQEGAFLERMLPIMACHGSIRAHQSLTREEMEGIVNELAHLSVPPYCPHGRPIFVTISYEQIEKDLKRR